MNDLFKEAMDCNNITERSDLLLEVIVDDPNHADSYLELGKCHIQLGFYDKAIIILQKSLEINDDGWAHLYLGHIYYDRLPNYNLAEKEFLLGADLLPELAAPVWCMAELREVQGRLDESEEFFRKAVEIESEDADCHAKLGRFLLRSVRIDEGKTSIKWALSLDKDCKIAQKCVRKYQLDL